MWFVMLVQCMTEQKFFNSQVSPESTKAMSEWCMGQQKKKNKAFTVVVQTFHFMCFPSPVRLMRGGPTRACLHLKGGYSSPFTFAALGRGIKVLKIEILRQLSVLVFFHCGLLPALLLYSVLLLFLLWLISSTLLLFLQESNTFPLLLHFTTTQHSTYTLLCDMPTM